MTWLTIISLILLAYILQIILLLAYPYYKYRKHYKSRKDRTIEGLVKFTGDTINDFYITLVMMPFMGAFCVLFIIIGTVIEYLYKNFIKNLHI